MVLDLMRGPEAVKQAASFKQQAASNKRQAVDKKE